MEPISKSSLADGVSERLILLLKEGKYRPGDRLPTERKLAEQFGVGRTSVREGLRYLEKMGILDIHQGRGITVRSLSLEDIFAYSVPLTSLIELPNKEIRDTMYARRLLERESVYLACENRTGRELGELEEVVSEMERSFDTPYEWLELDKKFHVTVARASGNAAFVQLIRVLWDIFVRHSEAILKNPKMMTSSTRFHREIYEAIEAGDGESARERMSAHLVESQEIVLDALENSKQDAEDSIEHGKGDSVGH